MATGYCECGCGGLTRIATRTRSNIGMVKGQPLRYIDGHSKRGKFGAYKKERYAIEDRGFSTLCWIWLLAHTPKGYGQAWSSRRQRMVGAHIVSYEQRHGPVPAGQELDHLCRVRNCVNPEHLEAVSHATNVGRGNYKTPNHRNARKTHCPKGHAYTVENTYYSQGARKCRTCVLARRSS